MVNIPDHEILQAARLKAGLSLEGLWTRCFELTGAASVLELEAILNGALIPNALQRDIIAQAINEAFMDRGSDDRVEYRRRKE